MVDVIGRRLLLNHRLVHDHHRVRQRQRLDLVVGDVYGGGLEVLVQPPEFAPHVDPQHGVEIGQGLIHQQDRRLHGDEPGHRHPLLLSTGQFRRVAVP